MLSAGELRHRITIQAKEIIKDPLGSSVSNWVDKYPNIPSSFEYLSAREFTASQAYQSNVVARVVIRWRPDLNASMRILYRDKIYNIVGALPDLDSGLEYITIPVSEGVNKG